jgi:hypothetical protein
MASQPHDKSGRKCSICDMEFTSHSYVGTITRKEGHYQIPKLVCRKCHNKHYEKGE